MSSENFGRHAEDIITGFRGIITGYCTYISGCAQYLITGKSENNKSADANWYDEQRVSILGEQQVILDNSTTPGCDISAPIR